MVHHFIDKRLQFLVFNYIPSKNLLWVIIYGNVQKKMKFNRSARKPPSFDYFFNEEFMSLKRIKGLFWDL